MAQWQGQRNTSPFRVPIAYLPPGSVESSPFYWHPQRFGARFAPEDFRSQLHEIHPDLEVTWHPIKERWLVWFKSNRVTDPKCPGWMLLFPVETSWGAYVPLDGRTLAAIYQVSSKAFGNGVRYWERLEAEQERDAKSYRAESDDRRDAIASERYDFAQIKNIGHGSKFANYHSGL